MRSYVRRARLSQASPAGKLKGDVAALKRIDHVLGAESDTEICCRQMDLSLAASHEGHRGSVAATARSVNREPNYKIPSCPEHPSSTNLDDAT
jgi:hypothetical protein